MHLNIIFSKPISRLVHSKGDYNLKILTIFTGGTIGSSLENDIITTDTSKAHQLLSMYQTLEKRPVTFVTEEPFYLHSENLTGERIAALCQCVLNHIHEDYDGIIVTHGTDTLQYTAAALEYVVPTCNLPILLVSSNYVLDHPSANGLANFDAAVEFIAAKIANGVFIPYKNSDGIIYFHRGTRVLPHRIYSDDVYSVLDQYYGTMNSIGLFMINPNYLSNRESADILLSCPTSWNSNVLRIAPYPGMEYPTLTRAKYKAVLLDTYHSGTLCSDAPDFQEFFQSAAELKIPVFLLGTTNSPDYESAAIWKDWKVTTLPLASPIAMYMKLWLALSQPEKLSASELEELMCTPIGDDIVTESRDF